MMFQADTAFAVELLALVAGTFLLVWVAKQEVCCKIFGKLVAYFTIAASILAMLCTFYYTVRYWEDGHFRSPHSMKQMQGMGDRQCMSMMGQMKGKKGMGTMMDPAMMQDMMANCPMMEKMMKNKDGMMMDQKNQPQPNKIEGADETDHTEHH